MVCLSLRQLVNLPPNFLQQSEEASVIDAAGDKRSSHFASLSLSLSLTQHRRNTAHTYPCHLPLLSTRPQPLSPLGLWFCSDFNCLAEVEINAKGVIVPVSMLCHGSSSCCLPCMSLRLAGCAWGECGQLVYYTAKSLCCWERENKSWCIFLIRKLTLTIHHHWDDLDCFSTIIKIICFYHMLTEENATIGMLGILA